MTNAVKSTMTKADMIAMSERVKAGETSEIARLISGEYDKYLRVYIRWCDELLGRPLEEMILDDVKLHKTTFERALVRSSNDVVAEVELQAALYALRYYRKVYEHAGSAPEGAEPDKNQDQ